MTRKDQKKQTHLPIDGKSKRKTTGENGEDEMKRYARIARQVGKNGGYNNGRLVNPEENSNEQTIAPKHAPHTMEFPTEMYNQLGELTSRGRGADPVLTSIRVPVADTGESKNLVTVFAREDDEIVNQRRAEARHPIVPKPLTATQLYKVVIPIPRRPEWRGMSRDQLHVNEERQFARWLQTIYATYPVQRLNRFEHNLNVWRQLWRVCERSDVVVMVADARHPLLHFSPGLYEEVTSHLRKPLVLVLNKIDLVPPEVLAGWKVFFAKNFPKVELSLFSSYPSLYLRSVFQDLEESVETLQQQPEEEDRVISAMKAGDTLDLSNKKSALVSSLSEHAVNVLKMKKSPIITPVGGEGLLECCRKVFIRHLKSVGVSPEIANRLDLESTRLLKRFDKDRLEKITEEKEREAQELRQKLLTDRSYLEKAAAGESEEEEQQHDSSSKSGSDDDADGSDEEESLMDSEELARLQAIVMGKSCKADKKRKMVEHKKAQINKIGGIRAWNEEEEETLKFAPKELKKGGGGKAKDAKPKKWEKKKRGEDHADEDDEDRAEDEGLDENAEVGYLNEDVEEGGDEETAESDEGVRSYYVNKQRFVLGMVGHPNAGKSSLINAITGKKVVSVSRQPGHTKHLQTILINEHCMLCDCPGLVFPAADISPAVQVASGITPVPQARELLTAVQHIGERIKLHKFLGLRWVQTEPGMSAKGFTDAKELLESGKAELESGFDSREDAMPWSAEDICHAYAVKRGFLNAKGRANVHQAAQAIVYMVVDGKIPFFATPPAEIEEYHVE
eukprot:GDKJ01017247.1.p1 GENE.GDKJ01017247.1~~GDKJ01017247.1.p1  ORF type:complete len:790 (-),score=222.53 GDKJ01017247.1:85-2454(-)